MNQSYPDEFLKSFFWVYNHHASITHQLHTSYLEINGIVLILEDSKCTKTWIDPWPELVVFFCGFSYGVFFWFWSWFRLQWRTGTCSKGRQLLEALGRLRGAPFWSGCRTGDPSPIRRCFRAVSARGKNWDSDCCVKSSARWAGSYWELLEYVWK